MKNLRRQRGSLMIVSIIMILVLSFLGVAITFLSVTSTHNAVDELAASETFMLAESGLERGIKEWSLAPSTYTGEGPVSFGKGTFTVTAVLLSPTQANITSNATVPTISGNTTRTIDAIVDLGGASTSIPTDDLADWPTEVLSKTDGTTSIVDGGIQFKINDVNKAKYKGHRETGTTPPLISLNAGESINLDFEYKKVWVTGTPDAKVPKKMDVDVEMVSTTGTSYVVWSENNEFNNPSWLTAPTINWTVPGGVTINRIRLSFDLQRDKRGYIPEVSFKNITISSGGGSGANIASWQEVIP